MLRVAPAADRRSKRRGPQTTARIGSVTDRPAPEDLRRQAGLSAARDGVASRRQRGHRGHDRGRRQSARRACAPFGRRVGTGRARRRASVGVRTLAPQRRGGSGDSGHRRDLFAPVRRSQSSVCRPLLRSCHTA